MATRRHLRPIAELDIPTAPVQERPDPEPPEPCPYREGNVVQLKSGGVPMTVQGVNASGFIECIWHDSVGHVQTYAFSQGVLRSY